MCLKIAFSIFITTIIILRAFFLYKTFFETFFEALSKAFFEISKIIFPHFYNDDNHFEDLFFL